MFALKCNCVAQLEAFAGSFVLAKPDVETCASWLVGVELFDEVGVVFNGVVDVVLRSVELSNGRGRPVDGVALIGFASVAALGGDVMVVIVEVIYMRFNCDLS